MGSTRVSAVRKQPSANERPRKPMQFVAKPRKAGATAKPDRAHRTFPLPFDACTDCWLRVRREGLESPFTPRSPIPLFSFDRHCRRYTVALRIALRELLLLTQRLSGAFTAAPPNQHRAEAEQTRLCFERPLCRTAPHRNALAPRLSRYSQKADWTFRISILRHSDVPSTVSYIARGQRRRTSWLKETGIRTIGHGSRRLNRYQTDGQRT